MKSFAIKRPCHLRNSDGHEVSEGAFLLQLILRHIRGGASFSNLFRQLFQLLLRPLGLLFHWVDGLNLAVAAEACSDAAARTFARGKLFHNIFGQVVLVNDGCGEVRTQAGLVLWFHLVHMRTFFDLWLFNDDWPAVIEVVMSWLSVHVDRMKIRGEQRVFYLFR